MPTPASPKAWKTFDYAALDASTSQFVQQQTGEIKALMKRTAQDIVEIGQKLVKVKEKLGHGRFGAWLEAEFEWSIQTAKRFMNVAAAFQNQQFVDFIAPSALYELAAPSIPDAVRDEALARAKAGESITYSTAKALKQKYVPSTAKPEAKAVGQLPSPPEVKQTLPLPSQSSSKLEIVAIRPPASKAPAVSPTSTLVGEISQPPLVPQPTSPLIVGQETAGTWWQLGGRHLLYSGDPNSTKFLQQMPEKVSLLLAFPSTLEWYTTIRAKTRIIADQYLPKGKDVRLFEDTLESNILLYSNVGEVVVSCFVPSVEILSIINRQDRRALLAEPDSKRVNAIISDWKLAGLKAERLG